MFRGLILVGERAGEIVECSAPVLKLPEMQILAIPMRDLTILQPQVSFYELTYRILETYPEEIGVWVYGDWSRSRCLHHLLDFYAKNIKIPN